VGGKDDRVVGAPTATARVTVESTHRDWEPTADGHPLELSTDEETNPTTVRRYKRETRARGVGEWPGVQLADGAHNQMRQAVGRGDGSPVDGPIDNAASVGRDGDIGIES